MYVQELLKNIRPKNKLGNQDLHVILEEENQVEVWGFREKENDLQEDGENKCLVNKCLLCHADNRTQRRLCPPDPVKFPL